MTGIEIDIRELADRVDIRDRQTLLNAVQVMADLRAANDRLRRENEALRLDVHFLDNGKKGLY